MAIERFGTPPATRTEYRAAGRFSGTEVGELIEHRTDPRSLGCPESLFLRVLEQRAAKRVAVIADSRTDANRRADAARIAAKIRVDELADFNDAVARGEIDFNAGNGHIR